MTHQTTASDIQTGDWIVCKDGIIRQVTNVRVAGGGKHWLSFFTSQSRHDAYRPDDMVERVPQGRS